MKKSARRLLCLVTALCLVLSLAPAAFADETTVKTAEALKTALQSGGSIILGADIDVNEALTVSEDTILDLNGHTLSVNHTGWENYAVLVCAALTVRDSSAAADGKITSATANTLFLDYGESAVANSLTLESGTVENTCLKMGDTAIVAVGTTISTVTISGGTVYSVDGEAIFSQAKTTISGGFFRGKVYLSMQEYKGDPDHQAITGGYFDADPDGVYDFYGKAYEVVQDTQYAGYPYKVQPIPAEDLVTVSYQFPEGSCLDKAQDHFRKGTLIDMPIAPRYPSYRFIAWTVGGSVITFPYQVNSNVTFQAVYVYVSPIPEGFFPDGQPLRNLYVGGIPMMENGVAAGTLPYQIARDTGTAALGYDETYGVYTLTLDTYANTDVYTGTLDTNAYNFGVYAEGNLAVILQENSNITATDAGASGAIGVAVTQGSLAIVSMDSGNKTLTVKSSGKAGDGMNIGVYADGDIAIYNCNLEVEASGGRSAGGVLAMKNSQSETANAYFDDAYVTAEASASAHGVGFGASGDVVLRNGSVLSARGAGGTYSYGAQCGDLTVDDDSIFGAYGAVGDGKVCRNSYGLASDKIDLVDGIISAYAGKANGVSYGVEAYDAVTVRAEGEFYCESEGVTEGDGGSYGIWCLDDITMEAGGMLFGGSGGMNDGTSCGVYAWGDMTVKPGALISGIGGDVQDKNGSGCSTGVIADKITVEAGGSVWGFGGDTASGESTGVSAAEVKASGAGVEVDEDDYEEEYLAYGAVYGRGGDSSKDYSYGVYLEDGMTVSASGTVYGYGGDASDGDSYGIYSEDDVVIDGDCEVQAYGGEAAGRSVGIYLESYIYDGVLLHISNGSRLEAVGGEAAFESIGVEVENGRLLMDGDDGTGGLRLDAEGGKATDGSSGGLYVSAPEGAAYAISLSDGAQVFATGALAEEDAGYGNSVGTWALGDIALNGAELYATATDGSDFSIGVFLYGEDLSLTLKNGAEVYAKGYKSTSGSAGVYFDDMDKPGTVSVAADCILSAYAGEAKISLAIGNVGTLTTGGTIIATAEGANGRGILMNNRGDRNPAISVTTGQLGASGQTAAIGAVSGPDSPIGNVKLTAPYIEYSENPDGTDTKQVKGKPAELAANGDQKHVLAMASGEISALSLSGINTALSYGTPVRFTAKALPQSIVKVEEERWVRISDGAVISSKNPTAPYAGTYRYELVLVPEEGFTFASEGDGVAVIYNDDYFFFEPVDGKLILTNETAEEEFVPDVTVEVPYYPPVGPTGGSSGSSGDKKTGEGMERVELPARAGQMVVIVEADGSETPVLLSYTENGVARALVPAGATVKVVDAKPMRFGDVKAEDWFAGAVDFVTSRGIFLGTDRGFEPGKSMNRAMMATVLFRISGEAAPAGGPVFGDVPSDAWFAEGVAWAAGAGVTNGRGGGFAPDAPVTREEIATMLYRFMQHLGLDVSGSAPLTGFPDGAETSPWAKNAMAWAVSVGLFRGDETGALNPGGEATRAEVATLVERLVKLIVG